MDTVPAMRATADRLGTAPLMGIRPGRVSAVSWVLGALLATVSGILHASGLPALQSTFMLGSLVWAVLAAALGGLTSLPGALLAATGLRASYRAMEVLHGVSLRVEAGQIVGVLGANGAGKTTALRVLAGLIRMSAGVVCLTGRPIAMLSPEERVEAGIALVTGGHDLFGSLTVLENLRIGAFTQRAGFPANCSEIL